MKFLSSMFIFPFFFPLFEQILVSSQNPAQPHTQEQAWKGQGREAANKPHLGLATPTRQLELLGEALGLRGNASLEPGYPGTKGSFSPEVPLLLHRPNTALPPPGCLYKPKMTSGVTSTTDQETEMRFCFPDTTPCSRKGNQFLQLHDYTPNLNCEQETAVS